MSPRIGSLFSGYGGLDLGVQQVIDGDVAWHVEFDEAPSRILAHHWPDVPNYGDVTAVDWSTVEPVDVITGGFPCQDVSLAGLRRGLRDGTRSGLWSEFARAIDALRPSLVVIENVRGLLSATADRQMESSPWGVGDRHDGPALRALGAVLGDLAELGYDAEWCGLRAADAGAPHGRFRVFIVAHPAGKSRRVGHGDDVRARSRADGREQATGRSGDAADAAELGRTWDRRARARRSGSAHDGRAVEDAAVEPRAERRLAAPGEAESGWPRSDAGGRGGAPTADDDGGRTGDEVRSPVERAAAAGDRPGGREWGPYGAAVERWERTTGRVAPAPTNADGRDGAHRLAPEFVEWMMGLPAGHVTDAPLTRAQQLKSLGNGVVPQQAALAVRVLLERSAVAA